MADPSSGPNNPADEVGSGGERRGTEEGDLRCSICGNLRRVEESDAREEGHDYCICANVITTMMVNTEMQQIMEAVIGGVIAAGSSSRTDQKNGLPEKVILETLVPEDYNHPSPEEVEDKCGICLRKFKNGDLLGRIKCVHKFHFDCIKRWLPHKNECPACKGIALAV